MEVRYFHLETFKIIGLTSFYCNCGAGNCLSWPGRYREFDVKEISLNFEFFALYLRLEREPRVLKDRRDK
jgi:hypothetical protein